MEGLRDSLTQLSVVRPALLTEPDCKSLLRCSRLTALLLSRTAMPLSFVRQLTGALHALTKINLLLPDRTADSASVAGMLLTGLPELTSLTLTLPYEKPAEPAADAAASSETKQEASAASAAAEAKSEAPPASLCAAKLTWLQLHLATETLFDEWRFPRLDSCTLSRRVRLRSWRALGAACPRLRELKLSDLPQLSDGECRDALASVRGSLQDLSLWTLPLVSVHVCERAVRVRPPPAIGLMHGPDSNPCACARVLM